ncbi:MAG: hypothetical protein HY228_02325 [Candidatus Yonathbacteria bacterium]|nr:hypothetical protein [Candidatus Yonathbacteria bacterium]
MEKMKWEMSNEIKLPKHSSRATPLEADKFFNENPSQEEIPVQSLKDFEETPTDRNSVEKRAIKELNDAREKFAFANEEKDPQEYARISAEYRFKVEKEKDFIIKHKKLTLEIKGLFEKEKGTYKKLNFEEVQYELDKYIKGTVVPHFAVVEAAKIQEARTEPSFIEKMKDSKWGSFAGKMIDGYRKMPWQKKLLVSVGLGVAGVGAGMVGGTFGIAVAGILTGGKGLQRLFSGAGTAVGLDAYMQKKQQEWMLKKGWGKDRHEYVSKQIALMSEKMRSGEVVDKDIEERLKERERIEKGNEIRRTGLAATAGVLVGSGAAFHAVRDTLHFADDYLGVSDYWGKKIGNLFGGHMKVSTEHSPVTTGHTPTAETISPPNIKPIELTVALADQKALSLMNLEITLI